MFPATLLTLAWTFLRRPARLRDRRLGSLAPRCRRGNRGGVAFAAEDNGDGLPPSTPEVVPESCKSLPFSAAL